MHIVRSTSASTRWRARLSRSRASGLAEGQTRLETKVNVLTIRMSNLDFKVTEGQEHLAEGLTHLNERQTRLEAGQSRMETSLQTVLTLLQAGSG
jgi:hypothetical protein